MRVLNNLLGVAIVVQVHGEYSASREANAHAWYSDRAVRTELDDESVFPLNRPILEEYLRRGAS
jgi:hypothetical protein